METKIKRTESSNNKIKEILEKQKQDEKRGTTYGARIAFDDETFTLPEIIKEIQNLKIKTKNRMRS